MSPCSERSLTQYELFKVDYLNFYLTRYNISHVLHFDSSMINIRCSYKSPVN